MSAVPNQLQGHRRKGAIGEEEAGAELKLGEFENVPTLSLSEAKLIIDTVIEKRKESKKPFQQTDTLDRMQEYLDMFARFQQRESISAISNLLEGRTELEKFERSQLASLCCADAEEAKYLIPSIGKKITDDELQEVCDEINKQRDFDLDGGR